MTDKPDETSIASRLMADPKVQRAVHELACARSQADRHNYLATDRYNNSGYHQPDDVAWTWFHHRVVQALESDIASMVHFAVEAMSGNSEARSKAQEQAEHAQLDETREDALRTAMYDAHMEHTAACDTLAMLRRRLAWTEGAVETEEDAVERDILTIQLDEIRDSVKRFARRCAELHIQWKHQLYRYKNYRSGPNVGTPPDTNDTDTTNEETP